MVGKVVGGKYRLEKRIGQGAFGEVYRATDLNLKRDVAIKFLIDAGFENAFKKKFALEAELMAKLMHPNIVAVFDFGEFEGRSYFVLEFVNGPSLMELAGKSSIPLSKVMSYAQQTCRGMSYAHGQGIIHRDLSLNNLMLNEHEAIKIVDFGLGKLMTADPSATSRLTGTPYYLAPEQIKGGTVDHRIDIFAFGVGFFRLANGYFPFQAEHPTAVLYDIVHETNVEFAEGVPEGLKEIILQCIEKNPAERYQNFNDIAKDLGMLMSTGSFDKIAEEPARVTTYVRSSKRNPYLNRVMIKNPDDFFGRAKEVKKIYSRLDAPHPQSISVVGERRLGKSSLLNYVYHRKNRKQAMQNYYNSVFIYIDLQRSPDITVPKFIDLLLSMLELEEKKALQTAGGEKDLDSLKEAIQSLSAKDKRVIILMDEFEMITKNENFDMQFFSFLRFLANNFKVAYVTSSAKDLQQLCHAKDIADSPFFNIFSNLPLRTFSRDEALELISVPSEREGIPLAQYAPRILELSGYFPLFIQIACSNLYEYLLEAGGGEPDWAEVTRSYREEVAPHYSFVWDKMDDSCKETICGVARGESVDSKYKHIADDLARRGYLLELGGGLAVFSSSFKEFACSPENAVSRKRTIFSLPWRKIGKKTGSEGR